MLKVMWKVIRALLRALKFFSLFFVLLVACLTTTGCKSEEEKRAEKIHEQDLKDVSNKRSAMDTWVPPTNFSVPPKSTEGSKK